MDEKDWMVVAVILTVVAVGAVVLLVATDVALFSVGGAQTVKVPLTGGWVSAAADGVDVYRFTYSGGTVYIYSSAYNSSVYLPASGQAGYLVYPTWNKRVNFNWVKTDDTYAYVKVVSN